LFKKFERLLQGGWLEELRAVGVAFVSLNEGIEATTPGRKLHLDVLDAPLARVDRRSSDGVIPTACYDSGQFCHDGAMAFRRPAATTTRAVLADAKRTVKR
jgi:hypothetical protein